MPAENISPNSVALLAEGVDRNLYDAFRVLKSGVALLAEGVDRNSIILRTGSNARCRPPRGGRG